MANCPECCVYLPIFPEDNDDGEIINCSGCGEELEIIFLEGGGLALESTQSDLEADFQDPDEDFDLEPEDEEELANTPPEPSYWCLDKQRK